MDVVIEFFFLFVKLGSFLILIFGEEGLEWFLFLCVMFGVLCLFK